MVSPVEANKGKLASVFKTAWIKTAWADLTTIA